MRIKIRFGFLLLFIFLSCQYAKCGFTTTRGGPRPIWNSTETDKLRQDLLLNYDKFARPTHHDNATGVAFGLTTRHLEVNELKSTFTVYAWVNLIWNDDKMKWNKDDYDGLDQIRMAEHEIWQPDIYLYNSASYFNLGQFANHQLIVYDSGLVLWVPSVQFSSFCEFNLKYWPFDTQKCSLVIGSWTHSGKEIDLKLHNNKTEVTRNLMVENAEWEIAETKMEVKDIYYDCCADPYPALTINITIQRYSPAYKTLIVTPAFVIIICVLATFALPPTSGEKILLNGCVAIITTLFLLHFTKKLPIMGKNVPLIVLFYSHTLMLICLSTVTAVVVLWIAKTKHSGPVPWVIKKHLTGAIGKWIGLSEDLRHAGLTTNRITAEDMRDHHVADYEENQASEDNQIFKTAPKSSSQHDWVLLAVAIDRISLALYSLIFAIFAVTYSL